MKVVFTDFLIIAASILLDHRQAPTCLPQPRATATLKGHRHVATSPSQLNTSHADCCVQPSQKHPNVSQTIHTLPGNMSAVSGAELASGFSKFVILDCFLELISSNTKCPSIAKMKKKIKNNDRSPVSIAYKKSYMVSKV